MVTMIHPDLAYSFRRVTPTVARRTKANAVLARVEQLLLDAGTAFTERRYRDAIQAYQDARSLLWSQLFPTGRYVDAVAIRPDLVPMLMSLGGEWLNVLPVEEVVPGVRPREVIDADTGPALGLRSAVMDAQGSQAVADLEMAELLAARGNDESAKFFRERATDLNGDLVEAIRERDAQPGQPAGGTPTGASGSGIPLGPGGILADRLTIEPGAFSSISRIVGADLSAASFDATIADRVNAPSFVDVPVELTAGKRTYTTRVGEELATISWDIGAAPAVDDVITKLYDARRGLALLPDVLIKPERESDAAVALAHAWYYETTLGLAECYHALGDWTAAESWYLRAARYQYLNALVEAPYVWTRLATLYRDWGDSLFRAGAPEEALPVYAQVLTADGQEGTSELYAIEGLEGAADIARSVIAGLAGPPDEDVNPAIAAVIYDVHAQISKIEGSLDFWGHWTTNVPIWTFDYLQSVATNFCQLAISAERDAMTFWEKAERGELTRLQLSQSVTLADAQREAAERQIDAAGAELEAYVAAEAAAALRAANARANAADYAQESRDWIMHQALSTQLSGGEDGDASELNSLADRMMQGGYSISGDRGTLAAAESLTAARLQREYEIDRLERQANELDAAQTHATEQREAAAARVAATVAAAHAATVRVQSAQELLAAFDDQRFTPDVWHALGEQINQHADRYLVMALDVAKRMQRAYNFENDVSRSIIRADYSGETVNGLLAADALRVDVQSFTYDLITSTAPKPQPIRQTISLAQRFPFLFETQLRATGRMEFQTTIDDFDAAYPGTYAGRIEHVEIDVDGILPARGVSGTLTNSGISHYRLPAALVAPGTSGLKPRVQALETLVLSDHDLRTDALLVDTDRRRRRIFEGAGVASSWTLELPPAVNELDYSTIVDVRLTITYEARYDPALRQQVLDELATRPSINERLRPLPLRWTHPDAFFSFYGTGVLDVSLDRSDFAAVELDPELTELSLLVTTSPRSRAEGIVLRVTGPGGQVSTVTTDADGIVAAADLPDAVGVSALGDYRIEIDAADNAAWVTDGQLELDAIQNVAMIVGYSFTQRS